MISKTRSLIQLISITLTVSVALSGCKSELTPPDGSTLDSITQSASSNGKGGGKPTTTTTTSTTTTTLSGGSTTTSSTSSTTTTTQPGGACMNSASDACIFQSSPVGDKGSPLSPALQFTTDLSSVQNYGVQIAGMTSATYLENANYKIYWTEGKTASDRVVKNAQGNWKYPYSICSGGTCQKDTKGYVAQIMAYYHLQHQIEAVESLAGSGAWAAKGKGITVITNLTTLKNNAYFSSGQNLIALGWASSTLSGQAAGIWLALESPIYNHEAGHADLFWANRDISDYDPPTTIENGNGCVTTKGCPGAINEAQADYQNMPIHPNDQGAMGQTWANTMSGLVSCGIPRKMGDPLNTNLTATQAYNACTSMKGEIHVHGVAYSTFWYHLRTTTGLDASNVDKLFLYHLTALAHTDTFNTALTKIIATAKANPGLNISEQAIKDAASRHGIVPE